MEKSKRDLEAFNNAMEDLEQVEINYRKALAKLKKLNPLYK
jgi:hypothetical protein